jgi:hypothetical protein
MAEVRQRTTGPKPTIPSGSTSQPAPSRTPSHSPSPADRIKAEDEAGLTLLDILRSITLLFLLSSALSWFITGESLIWNASRPAITTPSYWKSFFVRVLPFLPPLHSSPLTFHRAFALSTHHCNYTNTNTYTYTYTYNSRPQPQPQRS